MFLFIFNGTLLLYFFDYKNPLDPSNLWEILLNHFWAILDEQSNLYRAKCIFFAFLFIKICTFQKKAVILHADFEK